MPVQLTTNIECLQYFLLCYNSEQHMKQQKQSIPPVLAGIAGIGVISLGYLGTLAYSQNQQINTLENTAARDQVVLADASSTINSLQAELKNVQNELEDIADEYRDEKDRNEEFEDQIRDLAGTLGDLKKLEEIDEELLAKYSKVYFLNENFTPSRLKKIDKDFVLEGKGDQYFHGEALNFLENMIERAERDGHDLRVISAYRSFDQQSDLKGQFTQVYGSGANTFSADQGYSEHQLGTTVDLTIPDVGGTYTSFGESEAFKWLEENAYKYGFILSYPEGNNFYIYEPWHWRFVGRDLARDLNRNDKETFYTMDQRKINDYLLELFD